MKIEQANFNNLKIHIGKLFLLHLITLMFVLYVFNLNAYAQCPRGYELIDETKDEYICIKTTRFTGNWNDREKGQVKATLRTLKDADVRNWIVANVPLNRSLTDNVSPVSANGSVLTFRDSFFADSTKAATRENLLPFEAGKVFWAKMQNKPLSDGATLGTWFAGYAGGHFSVIGDMLVAKHHGENLTGIFDIIDTPSSFGHMFRAIALKLNRPAGRGSKQEWDSVMSEFRARIVPLFQMNRNLRRQPPP